MHDPLAVSGNWRVAIRGANRNGSPAGDGRPGGAAITITSPLAIGGPSQ